MVRLNHFFRNRRKLSLEKNFSQMECILHLKEEFVPPTI